jgi:uncharacterized RDD family membrane protein YckC
MLDDRHYDAKSKRASRRRSAIFLGERHASIVQRLSAKVIDLIIVVAIFLLGKSLWLPLGVGAAMLFCAFQDAMGVGQSIGKRIIGLRVLDEQTGFGCSMQDSLLRNVPFVSGVLFSATPVLWILLFFISFPLLALETYLILSIESGVRVGDVLGNTLVTEYLDDNLPFPEPESGEVKRS